jgi:hypothetical protein
MTVEDIKNIVLDEASGNGLVATWQSWSRFLTDRIHQRPDEILQAVEEAWNYFPHRSLNGKCPAELFAEHLRTKGAPAIDMTTIDPDPDKIDNAVLALLLLGLHENYRVWKGHDWDALERLHAKGYISDPATRAKSVVLTDEGMREAERLFKKLFAK